MGPAATPVASRANTPAGRVNVTWCDILRQNWDLISYMWSTIQGSRRPASAFQLEFPSLVLLSYQSAVKIQTQHVYHKCDDDTLVIFILQTLCNSDISE